MAGSFASEYLVQTDAVFPSPQLEEYAENIANAESRLHPSCVRFEYGSVKLATPGPSGEELRGQYSHVGLYTLRGQLVMGEEDALAFPPVTAVFARNAQWGSYGRLLIPHALTTAEWNLYAQKQVRPLRFEHERVLAQQSPAPPLSFSQELIEAVRAANGTHVLPSVAGDDEFQIRRVSGFVFSGF